jgi:hypothetical protein
VRQLAGWPWWVGRGRRRAAPADGGRRQEEDHAAGQGELTSRRRGVGRHAAGGLTSRRRGAGRHAAGGLTSWRGGVGGVPGGMAASSGRGCGGDDSGPAGRHGAGSRPPGRGIYIGRHGVGVRIYISAQVGPEVYIGGGWMIWGLSARGCLDRAPSIPRARVYHRQTVSTAWPRPGTVGKESTANPPVDPNPPVDSGGGGWAAGPVGHVTKSLFFSPSPLKTGPSQRTDHPHS